MPLYIQGNLYVCVFYLLSAEESSVILKYDIFSLSIFLWGLFIIFKGVFLHIFTQINRYKYYMAD